MEQHLTVNMQHRTSLVCEGYRTVSVLARIWKVVVFFLTFMSHFFSETGFYCPVSLISDNVLYYYLRWTIHDIFIHINSFTNSSTMNHIRSRRNGLVGTSITWFLFWEIVFVVLNRLNCALILQLHSAWEANVLMFTWLLRHPQMTRKTQPHGQTNVFLESWGRTDRQ